MPDVLPFGHDTTKHITWKEKAHKTRFFSAKKGLRAQFGTPATGRRDFFAC
jgi:hypothetical protein